MMYRVKLEWIVSSSELRNPRRSRDGIQTHLRVGSTL